MTIQLTTAHILAVAPSNPQPSEVVAALLPVLERYHINQTPERLGMFLAQWAHESNFVCQSENLNYRADRLVAVWPNRFPSLAAARPYAHNPQALANKVYNGRMGNREGTDDGWNFRGKGWPQLTGRANYERFSQLTGLDLVGNPSLIMTPAGSAAVCGAFWDAAGCNELADRGDMVSITQKINGGQNGFADRLARYRTVIKLLRAAPNVAAAPRPAPVAPPPMDIHTAVPAQSAPRVLLSQAGDEFQDITGKRVTVTDAKQVVINATNPEKIQVRLD